MTHFTCAVGAEYRSACKDLRRYPGTRYCVLHYPSAEKNKEYFLRVKKSKLDKEDYDFSGTVFPEGTSNFSGVKFDASTTFAGATFVGGANFSGAKFSGTETDFSGAEFSGGEETNFSQTKFFSSELTTFTRAMFSGKETTFSRGQFSSERIEVTGAQFSSEVTDFHEAKFSGTETDFSGTEFSSDEKTNFKRARFSSSGLTDCTETKFGGKLTDFTEARFSGEKTDFSRVEFIGEELIFSEAKFIGTETTTFAEAVFSGERTTFLSAQFSAGGTDFSKAQFSGGRTEFAFAQFSGEWTDFSEAKFGSEVTDFSGVILSRETDFQKATFSSQTDFHDVTFGDATFENVTFLGNADFTEAKFDVTPNGKTDFRRATFRGELYFRDAEFNGDTDFYRANFLDAVKFIGGKEARNERPSDVFASEGQISFTRARIDKPELFSFHTLKLRPSWLVGVDARKFDFTGVEWFGVSSVLEGSLDDEIKRVRQKGEIGSPYALLAQACQRLAANAEENRDYPTANEFHYWSMEAQRKEAAGSNFAPWRLIWWYWALSGYGERQIRAGMWLLGILVGFAALYIWKGPVGIEAYSLATILEAAPEALVYSLGVMTRLANDIPTSASTLVRSLIIIEGVLGPLQIGLFLLALRRKFMR
jgi:uncharacterized protein YjbI with pentapeptide repeats